MYPLRCHLNKILMWSPCSFQSTDMWKHSMDPEVSIKLYSQTVLWPKMAKKMHYSYSELTAFRCTNISEVAFTFQQWNRRKLGHLPITPDFPVTALSLSITMPAVFKPLSLSIMTIPFGLFLAAVFHKKLAYAILSSVMRQRMSRAWRSIGEHFF